MLLKLLFVVLFFYFFITSTRYLKGAYTGPLNHVHERGIIVLESSDGAYSLLKWYVITVILFLTYMGEGYIFEFITGFGRVEGCVSELKLLPLPHHLLPKLFLASSHPPASIPRPTGEDED